MELNCPACGKKLSIADEHAGRRMQCPLCKGEFVAPVLAPGMPALSAPPPPPPPAPPPRRVTDFQLPLPGEPTPSAPATPPPPRGEASKRFTLSLSPQVMQWLVPGCLWVVFILSFFTWVSYSPGGITIATQTAWQAAFGAEPWLDSDVADRAPFVKEVDDKKKVEPIPASGLLIFYLILIVPLTLFSLLAVLLSAFPTLAPGVVQKLVPWRWLLTGGLTLLTFLLLLLQLWQGLGLHSKVAELAESKFSADLKAAGNEHARKTILIQQGSLLEPLHRGWAPRTALLFHALALLSCALVWWLDNRPTQPIPRIEVWW